MSPRIALCNTTGTRSKRYGLETPMSEVSTVAQSGGTMRDQSEKAGRRWNVSAFLWILPALLIIALFTIYPVAYSVDLAVH